MSHKWFESDEGFSSLQLRHEGEKFPIDAVILGLNGARVYLPLSVLLEAAFHASSLLSEPRVYEGHWEAEISIPKG